METPPGDRSTMLCFQISCTFQQRLFTRSEIEQTNGGYIFPACLSSVHPPPPPGRWLSDSAEKGTKDSQ